jgi:hypothetical protein
MSELMLVELGMELDRDLESPGMRFGGAGWLGVVAIPSVTVMPLDYVLVRNV